MKQLNSSNKLKSFPNSEFIIQTRPTKGCCEEMFLCSLFSFCSRGDSISDNKEEPNRKNLVRRLLEEGPFRSHQKERDLQDPLEALIDLYTNNTEKSIKDLKKCRLNPDFDPKAKIRSDLEFFIPQICNFMVFHEKYQNDELNYFVEEACKLSFFFSHMVYWSLNSLKKIMTETKIIEYPLIKESLEYIIEISCQNKKTHAFLAFSEILRKFNQTNPTTNDEENHNIKGFIADYGTSKEKTTNSRDIMVNDLELKSYSSIYNEDEFESDEFLGYCSTLNFFEDLKLISEGANQIKKTEKLHYIKQELKKINEKLPAAVYVPFLKDSLRNYAVLKIAVEETRTFSTKSRTPFMITLEIFRPEEDFLKDQKLMDFIQNGLKKKKLKNIYSGNLNNNYNYNYLNFDLTLSHPITLKNTKKSSTFIEERPPKINFLEKSPLSGLYKPEKRLSTIIRQSELIPQFNSRKRSVNLAATEISTFDYKLHSESKLRKETSEIYNESLENNPKTNKSPQNESKNDDFNEIQSNIFLEYESSLNHYQNNLANQFTLNNSLNSENEAIEEVKYNEKTPSKEKSLLLEEKKRSISLQPKQEKEQRKNAFFGEDFHEQAERVKALSPFQKIGSWRITSLIVKTGDNLLQEQFALQLINQFYQIFVLEKTHLKLTTYEVLSLGPNFGIIEVIKNANTLDSLKKQFYNQSNSSNLSEFFSKYFQLQLKQARDNFCSSLAAYSLICYFLQVKDRHNGNIMLHKEGYLIHIDFGYFLSNSPGKGLELEKSVPFKFVSEYLEILKGFKSNSFLKFRKLFFKGFRAAIKHQNKIIHLVKMMFASHGTNLPCFKGGEICIKDLEKRLNPVGIHDDGALNIFIQNLINQSLDNLRTRWYDKFQYYCQGTFY